MNYCSTCGSKNLEKTVPEGDNRLRIVCSNCGQIHYQNPNMVVGCLPVYKGKILLARRDIEPRKGLWNLPCGFLENEETVEEGAIREVMEETGAEVRLLHLHTVYNLPNAQQVYLIFLAEMTSADFLEITSESSEVGLFDPEEIPWKEMAFSSSAFAIERYLANKHTTQTHFGTYYKRTD